MGSDNGLLPVWCQAIISTNHGLLLIVHIETNFSEIYVKHFSYKQMNVKMLPAKGRPFCLGMNVLNTDSLGKHMQKKTLRLQNSMLDQGWF